MQIQQFQFEYQQSCTNNYPYSHFQELLSQVDICNLLVGSKIYEKGNLIKFTKIENLFNVL